MYLLVCGVCIYVGGMNLFVWGYMHLFLSVEVCRCLCVGGICISLCV